MPINNRARIDSLAPVALSEALVVVIVVPVVIIPIVFVPIIIVIVVPVIVIPVMVVVSHVDRGSAGNLRISRGRLRLRDRLRRGFWRWAGCLGRRRRRCRGRLVGVFYDRAKVAVIGAGDDVLDEFSAGDDR